MSLSEFDLIKRYFESQAALRDDVVYGMGDDAAICRVPANHELLVTVDTLVAGVHFPSQTDAASIAHKALAVNLSDIAAMGGEPAWATLALTLPEVDEAWLKAFSQGLFELAATYQVQLVGGDTTRGPLSVTIQMMGFAPPGRALRRSAAVVGDLLYVTGTLGDAGVGLALVQSELEPTAALDCDYFIARLNRPQPRVREALALRALIHAAIDISDGLVSDLGHILHASGVGATLMVEQIPVSPALKTASLPMPWWQLALSAGDDYELCFSVSRERQQAVEGALQALACPYCCIGRVEAQSGLRLQLESGEIVNSDALQGFQHFSNDENR